MSPRRRAGPSGLTRESRILRLLAREPAAGMRLSDVADAVGLGKSTVHRLLAGLRAVGWVQQDAQSRRYHLGFELVTLGQAAAARYGLLDVARPSLRRLADQTEDTVYLIVREGDDAVCVARLEGTFPIRTLTLNVGDRRPLGVGSGALALLAFLPDAETERVLDANAPRYRQYSFFDPAGLHAAIAATRQQGYAMTDGLIVAGMQAVSVPILGRTGRAAGAVTVAAISERMRPERRANIVAAIQREVRRIEAQIAQGHAAPAAALTAGG